MRVFAEAMEHMTPQTTLSAKPGLPAGKIAGAVLAVAALLIVEALPLSGAISPAGHHMLAILAFAVIIWISEALDYTVSSFLIAALITLLLGFAPEAAGSAKLIGTGKALGMAFSGFSNSGLILVAAALFIAAAMTITGLDKRIAMFTMSKLGAGPNLVLIGTIVVTILLSLVVPSATARTACVVPIMMGGIAAMGVNPKGRLAAAMIITIAQATSIWNIGILTSAAQNLLSRGFIEKQFGADAVPTWGSWLLAGGPWAVLMSVVLFFVVKFLLPPEVKEFPGGKEAMARAYKDLGPMTAPEKRLGVMSLILILLWATEKQLHDIDTASSTIAGITLMLLPGIGVMTWKQAQGRIPWGTVIVFGIGISLGSTLLSTGAAQYLADILTHSLNLSAMGGFMIFAVLSAFLILIHLGFASATALTSSLMPVMLGVLASIPGINGPGIAMLLAFTVSFGFILPINAPQNMVCLGTETFTTRQFTTVGICVSVIGYLMLLLFALTWWPLLGLI